MRKIVLMGVALLSATAMDTGLPVRTAVAAPSTQEVPVLSLNSTTGITPTFDAKSKRELTVATGAGATTDGDGALLLKATSATGEGSKYHGIMVPLGKTIDLTTVRLLVDARSDQPENTQGFYVRGYNKGENKAALSFASWTGQLKKEWRTFSLQPGMTADGLEWEPQTVEERKPDHIDRLEFIVGTRQDNVPLSLSIDNLRSAPRLLTIQDLTEPKKLVIETPLVAGGQAVATILHPDSTAGRAAAERVAALIEAQTGVKPTARVATEADREPTTNVIALGNVDNNPALHLLYSRYFTPVDSICPGAGGSLVHTVHDPFGKGFNVVVLGASDDAGLQKATDAFAKVVAAQPKGRDLKLPRLFVRNYSPEFLKRYAYADDPDDPKRLQAGLDAGQKALDEGKHTSIAGELSTAAMRYQLTGNPTEARLFVALWDLYAKSAVADPRKYGGPWGFDSDFPSSQVVAGWDNIEEDPSLTDAERLRVVKSMARWLGEAVIPKAAGNPQRVAFNHQTFPGLGTMMAGLYFSNGYNVLEGPRWLKVADALFQAQQTYFKSNEDCNGYQWLTDGHMFRYAMARPDFTVFKNGNGRKIVDYCIGTMDNLGIQVPYGDTGSWQCWNSEMICLDMFAYATGDATARWAANLKRAVKNTYELYSFYQMEPGTKPANFDGVRTWPLEPAFVRTFPEENRPPDDQLFDKISFRDRLDPAASYLLLDGLSNGGHKHLDGNSLERLTQYDRIWLADNDYFKAQVKYHNSMLIFKDGESTDIPPYVGRLGAGETARYGYSHTRLSNYTGVDWDRYVVWLKQQQAFVVIDKLTAKTPDEYQFRLLWHGVGDAQLTENGMLLKQKGPSLWIQTAAGPQLTLFNDTDLGTNWAGYKYADPVVRSMSGIAKVKLNANESYVYATIFHGNPNGDAAPWKIERLKDTDGFRIDTGQETLGVLLKAPAQIAKQDAQVAVIDSAGATLLGSVAQRAAQRAAQVGDSPIETNRLAQVRLGARVQRIAAGDQDIPNKSALETLKKWPVAPAPRNLEPAAKAPALPQVWAKQPAPDRLILSGNRNTGGAVPTQAKLSSDVQPAAKNVFDGGSANNLAALLDGEESTTGGSVMYDPDKTVKITADLGSAAAIDTVRWSQWWATTSSRQTAYILDHATVEVSDDNFVKDIRKVGEVTDAGPHSNFGAPIAYRVEGNGAKARYIRLTIQPKAGTAVYLAELYVEGKPSTAQNASPYHFTRIVPARLSNDGSTAMLVTTAEGTLLALDADGKPLWTKNLNTQLNDVAAANLSGDALDEIVLARQDQKVTVLDATGKELWSRELSFYRRPPYVNLVRTGDIDGDGKPEVIAGGENWRFYAFTADGKELWNYEAVHPSRSGAVADLDGDGKDEVICGTHYYAASVLKSDGTPLWKYSFGPICYDIATGSFDGNKTRGVIFGGGDGILHYLDNTGQVRLKLNTGDEVRKVATADLDGDGRDEILGGSMNSNLYCINADTKRRWRHDLGDAVTALVAVPDGKGAIAVAGTSGGNLYCFDAAGKLLTLSKLGSAVVTINVYQGDVVVGTADGQLRRLKVKA